MKQFLGVVVVLLLVFGAWFYLQKGKEPQENEGGQQVEESITEAQVFFYVEEDDKDESGNILCSADAVKPVTRQIKDYSIEKHLRALLEGPTAEEKANGFSSEYPLPGFTLENAELSEDGVLHLTFSDPEHTTAGGSCRVGILASQLIKTAETIEGVTEVEVSPEDLFQP